MRFPTKYYSQPYRGLNEVVYDYEICPDEEALSTMLDEINHRRFLIVAVTQASNGAYTIVFVRPVA